jgi:hypothetical protein
LFLSFLFKSDKFSDFLTLQDKHNIRTLSLNKIHLYSLRNRPYKLAILPVSKAHTNIFTDNVRILYIYIHERLSFQGYHGGLY